MLILLQNRLITFTLKLLSLLQFFEWLKYTIENFARKEMKRILIISIILILPALSSWAISNPSESDTPSMRDSLGKDRDNAQLNFTLGASYLIVGDYQKALAPLKRAIELQPLLHEAHFYLGLTYGALGKRQEKIASLKEAIRLYPDFPEANFKLALAHAAQGRHQEASLYYQNSIKSDPDNTEVHYFLALSYYLSNRYKEALKSLMEAIRLDPGHANAHYTLGLTHLKLGHYRRAIMPLKTAMKINPRILKEQPSITWKQIVTAKAH